MRTKIVVCITASDCKLECIFAEIRAFLINLHLQLRNNDQKVHKTIPELNSEPQKLPPKMNPTLCLEAQTKLEAPTPLWLLKRVDSLSPVLLDATLRRSTPYQFPLSFQSAIVFCIN